MRLSAILASHVSSRSRSRGASYAAAGAVTHIERHGSIVQAIVRGSQNYDVGIEHEGALLLSSCTCPYFLDHLEICKHIWAVVLTAETRGIPLVEPGTAPNRISLEPIDLDDDFFDIEDADSWLPDVTLPARRAPAAGRLRTAPPPWQQLLDRIVSAPAPDAAAPLVPRVAPGQLLYVLDVDASLQAGTAVMELMTRDRKKSGEWGKPRAAHVASRDVRLLPAGPDRAILERLLGASPNFAAAGFAPLGDLARFRLEGVLLTDLLPPMCEDGRCMVRIPDPAAESATRTTAPAAARATRYFAPPHPKPPPTTLLPLEFDNGPPWRFDAVIERDDAAAVYRIDGALARDGERMEIDDPLLVLADGLLVMRTHVARLDHHNAFQWLAALRRERPVEVPITSRTTLLDALLVRPLPLRDTPDDLRVEIEDGIPRPLLRLTPAQWRDRLEAAVQMVYGDLEVAPMSAQPLVRSADASRVVRRDLEAERGFVERLHALGFRREWSPRAQAQVPQLPVERLPRVVGELVGEGWHVEARGVTYRRPGAVTLAVTSGIDWFDVEGSVDYGGQPVPLPELLAAVRRGDAFVTLGDGTQGLLPEEWLKTSGALARMGKAEGTGLRFQRSQVALLDALLATQPAVTCDETFARARDQLATFDGIAAADPPPAFAGTLREYQRSKRVTRRWCSRSSPACSPSSGARSTRRASPTSTWMGGRAIASVASAGSRQTRSAGCSSSV